MNAYEKIRAALEQARQLIPEYCGIRTQYDDAFAALDELERAAKEPAAWMWNDELGIPHASAGTKKPVWLESSASAEYIKQANLRPLYTTQPPPVADIASLRAELAAAVAERDDYRAEFSGLCHTLSVGSEGRPEMTAQDWRKRVDQGIDFLMRPLLLRIEATDRELAKRSKMLDICTQNCSDWIGRWKAEQDRAEQVAIEADAEIASLRRASHVVGRKRHTGDQVIDYHGRIMNIECKLPYAGAHIANTPFAAGHRDARHAAAEIALEAQAEIAGLRAALLSERERICAAIKATDDAASLCDYMLDSDDCIAVIRGELGPSNYPDAPARANGGEG